MVDFNPRSREGSDVARVGIKHSVQYFNPRSREGSDQKQAVFFHVNLYFNPRSREGSDTVISTMLSVCSDFNPRSREGSDRSCPGITDGIIIFQSALPRGERRHIPRIRSWDY